MMVSNQFRGRFFRVALLAGMSAMVMSCGSNTVSGPPQYVSVTIGPRPFSVAAGSTVVFTGTVSNNLSIPEWSLLYAASATSPAGTLASVSHQPDEISYTAPAAPPLYDTTMVPNCFVQGTVTLQATVQPPAKSVVPVEGDSIPIIITGGPITAEICPQSPSVPLSSSLQFVANAIGSDNPSFTWQVDGVTGGSTDTGTITPGGLYTAPGKNPGTGKPVTVTAIWNGDITKTATAEVVLQ